MVGMRYTGTGATYVSLSLLLLILKNLGMTHSLHAYSDLQSLTILRGENKFSNSALHVAFQITVFEHEFSVGNITICLKLNHENGPSAFKECTLQMSVLSPRPCPSGLFSWAFWDITQM